MKKYLVFISIIALVVPLLSFAQSSLGQISGKVIDEEGRAIIGVDVHIFGYREGEWHEGSFNKEKGTYQIKLPEGSWFIGSEINEDSGFTGSGINNPVYIGTGQYVSNRHITLKRVHSIISGKVSLPEGNNLKNVLVNIFSKQNSDVFSGETDETGFYRFLVPSGSYSVSAFSAPSNGTINPEEKNLTVGNAQLANLNISFKSSDRVLTGRVLPEDGTGAFALVSSWSDKGYYTETRANALGDFVLKVRENDNDIWHVKAAKILNNYKYISKEATLSIVGNVSRDLVIKSVGKILPNTQFKAFLGTQSATAQLSNGMTVSIPSNGINRNVFTLSVSPAVRSAQKSLNITGSSYEVIVKDVTGSTIDKLNTSSAIIEVPYDEKDLAEAGIDETQLKLFRWDSLVAAWRPSVPSVVDTKQNKVIGLTKFLGGFAIVGSQQPGGGEVPNEEPVPEEEEETPTIVTPSSGGSVGITFSPPTAASNLTATADSSSIISLKWSDPKQDETTRTVERSLSPLGPFAVVSELSSVTLLSFTDTGLAPDTVYFYRVRSTNADGTTSSIVVNARTLSPPPDTFPPTIALSINVKALAAELSIITNEAAASTLTCTALGNTSQTIISQNPNFSLVYVANLNNLESETEYSCEVEATDELGNSGTASISFTTGVIASGSTGSEGGEIVGSETPTTSETPDEIETPVATILKNLPLGFPSTFRFNRSLNIGSTGEDVLRLQQLLNTILDEPIAVSGPGSPGGETFFYGPITTGAVHLFQQKFLLNILIAQGIPQGTDNVGPGTRAALNQKIIELTQ